MRMAYSGRLWVTCEAGELLNLWSCNIPSHRRLPNAMPTAVTGCCRLYLGSLRELLRALPNVLEPWCPADLVVQVPLKGVCGVLPYSPRVCIAAIRRFFHTLTPGHFFAPSISSHSHKQLERRRLLPPRTISGVDWNVVVKHSCSRCAQGRRRVRQLLSTVCDCTVRVEKRSRRSRVSRPSCSRGIWWEWRREGAAMDPAEHAGRGRPFEEPLLLACPMPQNRTPRCILRDLECSVRRYPLDMFAEHYNSSSFCTRTPGCCIGVHFYDRRTLLMSERVAVAVAVHTAVVLCVCRSSQLMLCPLRGWTCGMRPSPVALLFWLWLGLHFGGHELDVPFVLPMARLYV